MSGPESTSKRVSKHHLNRREFLRSAAAAAALGTLPSEGAGRDASAAARPVGSGDGVAQGELIRFASPWTSPYRVDGRYPYQLINGEGEHLFVLCKTAWAYFGCRDPEGYLAKARVQGINVIRVALEGRPYFADLGIDLWPWGGTRKQPDFTSFSEPYWEEVERRIRLAGSYGIGFDVVLYMALKRNAGDEDEQLPYWAHVIQRFGRYSNVLVWEVRNENLHDKEFQDAVGRYFVGNDPWKRPVCTSSGTSDDAPWPYSDWMKLAIIHTCTGSKPLQDWYLALARNGRAYGKPLFCNESGREKRHHNDDPIHRRKQGWVWCSAGGFWTWHSWDGCEGINDRSYRAPGEQYVRPMADFFGSVPFWRMAPNMTAVRVENTGVLAVTMAEPDRATVVSYLCTETSGHNVAAGRATLRLHGGRYTAEFLVPASLQPMSEPRPFATKGIWEEAALAVPSFVDDLVLLVRKEQPGRDALMPGTG